MKKILEQLPGIEAKVREQQDLILTNLVMLGEIPAPTFHESNRMRFLVNRLTQAHLVNCSTDEVENGVGILPGKREDRNILVVAHTDTVVSGGIPVLPLEPAQMDKLGALQAPGQKLGRGQ